MRIPTALLALSLALISRAEDIAANARAEEFFSSPTRNHTNNWAVLVSASKYWFNYRHMANVVGLYRTVKRLDIPDSNIILMMADDAACNTRNSYPGAVYSTAGRQLDLYGDNVEVDYRGYEVTVESFIRLLTGRVEPDTPRSKRLLSDDRSNVFVYLTGHGGEDFLKFQDQEEISSFDLADSIETMWQKKRYNELFLMIDSCQASSMYSRVYSPNVLATASSRVGESSYADQKDREIGIFVIDAYTLFILNYLESINKTSGATMQDMFSKYNFEDIKSNAQVRSDLWPRPLDATRLTDFFGGVTQVEVTEGIARLGEGGTTLSEPTVAEAAAWRDVAESTTHEEDSEAEEQVTVPVQEGWGYLKVGASLLGLCMLVGSAVFLP